MMQSMPGIRMLAVIALLGWTGTGCASHGSVRESRDRVAEEIRARGLDPETVVIPFELTEPMRVWVHQQVPRAGQPEARLQDLLLALFQREQGGLTYERGRTATASEVWTSGIANCLSFTHLFVGLSRELGLDVYYLRVSDLQHFEKDGDLVVASEHVTAAFGPPTGRLILDFSEQVGFDYRQTAALSDLTAIALYYSNLGAAAIRDGESQRAQALLETAVRLDAELPDGWVNYGVVLRRSGRIAEAEAAFRRALEANPRTVSAYTNLAALLDHQGRAEEARSLLEIADRSTNRNPYSYLALGDLSLREGRLEEAGRYFRRAQRLAPGSAEAAAALGQWKLASGDRRSAQRWLRKARALDPEAPRIADLERRLSAGSPRG